MKKISNAIILRGPGIGGNTLINNILFLHKDLYWVSGSGYLNNFPNQTGLPIHNNIQRIKYFENLNRIKNSSQDLQKHMGSGVITLKISIMIKTVFMILK